MRSRRFVGPGLRRHGLRGGDPSEVSPYAAYSAAEHWVAGSAYYSEGSWSGRIAGYTLTQPSAPARPSLLSSGSNPAGVASLDFAGGSSQFLSGAGVLAQLVDSGSDFQLYMSVHTAGTGGVNRVFGGFGDSATLNEYGRVGLNTSDQIVARYRDAVNNVAITGSATSTDTSYWVGLGRGGSDIYYVSSIDAETSSPAAGATFTADRFVVGRSPDTTTSYLTGEVVELVVFTSRPSAGDRTAIEALLSSYIGI